MRSRPLLRSASLGAPILVVAAGAATLASAAAAPDAPAASAARAAGPQVAGPVVSPRPGQVVRSHVVRVRVRSGDLPGVLRVRLNGVPLGADFGPSVRGVRTLRTSVSHGLRRGRNALRVTVARTGRPARRETVRFTVRTRRTLTGAGRDRRIVVGARAGLLGRALVVRRGRHVPARWRLVGGPGVRRARGARAAAAGSKPPAGLTSPAGLTAGFRPLAPGRYTVQLTSGSGSARTTDHVTLTAVPPNPLVRFDTMPAASASERGIAVGGTTYLLREATNAPRSSPAVALQVLVLERSTLAAVSNTAYEDTDDVLPDLQKLDDSKLAIVSLQPAPGASNQLGLDGLERSLGAIGFPTDGRLPHTPGSLSGVGVRGLAAGLADVSIAPYEQQDYVGVSTYGRMQGYLSPDQYGNYGFVAPQRVPFRFAAPDAPCGPGSSCAGSVGFRVRVQDWKTLAPAADDGTVYQTGRPDLTAAQQTAEAERMAGDLTAVRDGDVVTIQAVSARAAGASTYAPPVGPVERSTLARLSDAVAGVGGTRHGVNSIARASGSGASGGSTYALVGWKGAAEGDGAEVAANVDGVEDAPALRGVLRPDGQSRYRPAEVTESDVDPSQLASTVLAAPSNSWPLSDPAHRRAMAYIGTKVTQLGSDPRSAYWSQGFTQSETTALALAVSGVGYPAGADFTADEFVAARRQLADELALVGRTRDYLARLAQPFSEGALGQWVTAQTVADKVFIDAERPEDEVALQWVEFTTIVLELLGPLTEEASATLAGFMELGVWAYGSSKNAVPGAREVRVQADELGKTLVDRAQQTKATFDRMGDVIVSDYAKLRLVGTWGGCAAGNAGCPAWLALSANDMLRNTTNLALSVERLAYEKLLPLGYNVMQLVPAGAIGVPSDGSAPPDATKYACEGTFPWEGYSHDAFASRLRVLDPAGRSNRYDTYVLSRPPGASTQHGTPPPDAVLERMFAPVSRSLDPNASGGGLGMEPGPLLAAARHRTWFRSPEREASNCGWRF